MNLRSSRLLALLVVDSGPNTSLTEPTLRFRPDVTEVTSFEDDFLVVYKLPKWISCDFE